MAGKELKSAVADNTAERQNEDAASSSSALALDPQQLTAGADEENMARVRAILDALSAHRLGANLPPGAKPRYAFWETQPVAQFQEDGEQADGPIDAIKTVAEVQQEPYGLPVNFEWSECNMQDEATVKEVYSLLTHNYVEDDDAMFRFDYSADFLAWAVRPPGYKAQWHVGVRAKTSGKLVGFITAIPATIRVRNSTMKMVEINFLCVHKKLRSKRLAPVLIKEITRRVNLCDIWQAAYTAGVVLPKPVAECQYWHRSLNPKKLISVGFSKLQPRMTLARTIKLYKVPDTPQLALRPMVKSDVPQVTQLLSKYLVNYQLVPVMTEEEVAHWLLPIKDVVNTYVAETGGKVTDLISFYTLPSSILNHPEYSTLKAAYMFYTVATSVSVSALMADALVCARNTQHDVFNALDILENHEFLKDLKFGIGDGKLRYYLYNWRVAQQLEPSEVGLVML